MFELSEDLTDRPIKLSNDIVIKVIGRIRGVEILGGCKWFVRHRVGQIKEKRTIALEAALDEIKSALCIAFGQRCLYDRVPDDFFIFDELHRTHIVRVQDSVVLIESLPAGQVLERMAQVPLADTDAGVAGLLERFGNRNLGIAQADIIGAGVG